MTEKLKIISPFENSNFLIWSFLFVYVKMFVAIDYYIDFYW